LDSFIFEHFVYGFAFAVNINIFIYLYFSHENVLTYGVCAVNLRSKENVLQNAVLFRKNGPIFWRRADMNNILTI